MTNEEMLGAVLALPDADLMTASKIDDPIGAGAYYRADTVVRLLAAERRRCANAVRALEHGPECGDADGYMRALSDAEAAILGA